MSRGRERKMPRDFFSKGFRIQVIGGNLKFSIEKVELACRIVHSRKKCE